MKRRLARWLHKIGLGGRLMVVGVVLKALILMGMILVPRDKMGIPFLFSFISDPFLIFGLLIWWVEQKYPLGGGSPRS